ncbi:Hypothetical predicted protein, partial [Pelobates cultripes]
ARRGTAAIATSTNPRHGLDWLIAAKGDILPAPVVYTAAAESEVVTNGCHGIVT